MVPRLQSAGFVWRQNENINLVRSLRSRTVQCHDRRAATAEHHPTASSIDTTHGAAAFEKSTQTKPAALTTKSIGPVKSQRSGTTCARLSAAFTRAAFSG